MILKNWIFKKIDVQKVPELPPENSNFLEVGWRFGIDEFFAFFERFFCDLKVWKF